MQNIQDAVYWLALSELNTKGSGWQNKDTVELIIKFYHEHKLSPADFFLLDDKEWLTQFELNEKQIPALQTLKSKLPNYSFLAEELDNAGIEIIPMVSPRYPTNLKKYLKKQSPIVLYAKGNVELLNQPSIAIVGSRKASQVALDFTQNVAHKAVTLRKPVVSGFAEGVDKQATKSALEYGGTSIVVFPQGILKISASTKELYPYFVENQLLYLSSFQPKAAWHVSLAMQRNGIIYGLADEVYIAESGEKGGTWEGVLDGMQKGAKIYVRMPFANEQNANLRIINRDIPVKEKKGIITAVDDLGNNINLASQTDTIKKEIPETQSVLF